MFPTTSSFQRIAAALTLLFITCGYAQAELPAISEARIIQPPPGAKVAAGYFTIANPTDKELVITGATSDQVSTIELHLSSVVDDVARMQKQEELIIPAGQSLELKHGSYHLMMMGLVEPLTAGNELDIVMDTSAGPLIVTLPVITPDAAMSMDKMNHDSMDMKHEGHNMDAMDSSNEGDAGGSINLTQDQLDSRQQTLDVK